MDDQAAKGQLPPPSVKDKGVKKIDAPSGNKTDRGSKKSKKASTPKKDGSQSARRRFGLIKPLRRQEKGRKRLLKRKN